MSTCVWRHAYGKGTHIMCLFIENKNQIQTPPSFCHDIAIIICNSWPIVIEAKQ